MDSRPDISQLRTATASPIPRRASEPADNVEWWQRAVIYEIAPISFEDSNGDGDLDEGVKQFAGPCLLRPDEGVIVKLGSDEL
jgi:hypothetical protein